METEFNTEEVREDAKLLIVSDENQSTFDTTLYTTTEITLVKTNKT